MILLQTTSCKVALSDAKGQQNVSFDCINFLALSCAILRVEDDDATTDD